jgi:uncharacterized membrane protein SpoIIM required for sporulation
MSEETGSPMPPEPNESPGPSRGLPRSDALPVRAESPTEELVRLLAAAESHRLRALAFDDLRRLARLYRGESARLARLRDRGGDQDEIGHLNSLCVRAHGFLYEARLPPPDRRAAWQAFVIALAGTGRLQAVAWAILLIGAIVGYSLVALDPAALYALMPASLGYDTAQIDVLYRSTDARTIFLARESTAVAENAIFGSYLFANNTRVGILAFATGLFFGLPTVLLQFYNGIMIGTISAIFMRDDLAFSYLTWILPHGVPELTAITLCSAAGLCLGSAIAAPGRLTRGEALRHAGPPALALFLASVPLFFVAAWIESFIRESALGTAPRVAVAALGVVALLGFAVFVRRHRPPESNQVDWIDDLIARNPNTDPSQAAP